MDYNKYNSIGWGLSNKALEFLFNLFKEKDINNVIEFGSGKSTSFLVDVQKELKKEINITSFDNDIEYSYSGKETDIKIRDLIECSNEDYEKQFKNKKFNKDVYSIRKEKPHTRQLNCFYDIKKGDLKDIYDLVILDGPHGNGRNISFLVLKDHLKSGSYILIDDYTHYDFVDRLKSIYDVEEIFRFDKHTTIRDNFIIFKLK